MKQPVRTYHLYETGEIVSLLERTERLIAVFERVDALCRHPGCISPEQRDKLFVDLLAEQEQMAGKGSA